MIVLGLMRYLLLVCLVLFLVVLVGLMRRFDNR